MPPPSGRAFAEPVSHFGLQRQGARYTEVAQEHTAGTVSATEHMRGRTERARDGEIVGNGRAYESVRCVDGAETAAIIRVIWKAPSEAWWFL